MYNLLVSAERYLQFQCEKYTCATEQYFEYFLASYSNLYVMKRMMRLRFGDTTDENLDKAISVN